MVRCSSHDDRWRCSVTNGEFEIVADTAKSGGTGDGFRPHELLAAALSSCLNITARMAADENDIPLEGVTTTVDLQRSPDRTEFAYTCEFGAVSEREPGVLRDALSDCPVQRTLSKEVGFEVAD